MFLFFGVDIIIRMIHNYNKNGRVKCSGEPYRDPIGNDHPNALIDASKLLLKSQSF